MDRYIGIDVHLQSCTVAVVSPSGKRLDVQVVPTLGAELVERIRSIGGQRHICLEEGTQSEWLFELLSPHAVEVVVTVPAKRSGSKNDASDALALAERLRVNALELRVFKAGSQCGALRAAVRGHLCLTQDLVRIKCRLQAMARSRGLQAGEALYDPEKRQPWLERLPPRMRALGELLAAEHDAVAPLQATAEKVLVREARTHKAVSLLKQLPGFGDIRAGQLVAVVVTPHRFRSKRQLWAYCGLGVVTRVSAEWGWRDGKRQRQAVVQTRGLNRNHHPLLKSILKGAAHTVVTKMPQHPLSQQFQRQVAAGTRPNLALLTLARRLAATALSMWKHQEDYDPAKHCLTKLE
jgi:transposase